MEKLKGIEVNLPEEKFNWQGDFLWYDGPLFSHFKYDENDDYFMLWKDHDEKYHRWILYRTPSESLIAYFKKETSDVELILNNPDGFVFFVDVDSKWSRVTKVKVEDIPEIYLPDPKAYFNFAKNDNYAIKLKDKILSLKGKEIKYLEPKVQPPSLVSEPKPPIYKKKKKTKE